MQDKIIQELLDAIEKALSEFEDAMPSIQKETYKQIELLVKELQVNNGNITPNIDNLKKITGIKSALDGVFNSSEYTNKVIELGRSLTVITDILEKYFNKNLPEFSKMPPMVFELRKQAVSRVIDSLTNEGLSVNITEKAADILRKNITSGASFFDLNSEMRDFITGNAEKEGALLSYSKRITTDILNQYARSVSQIISADLGLEWHVYVGAIVKHSRPFCCALVAKEFIHKSELEEILKGQIDGKNVSLAGLMPGTTVENFPVVAGGYQCNHQYLPVSTFMVPKNLIDKINAT